MIAPPLEEEDARQAKIDRVDQKAEAKTHYEAELASRSAVPVGLLSSLTIPQLMNIAGKRNVEVKKGWGKSGILAALDPVYAEKDKVEVDDEDEDTSD